MQRNASQKSYCDAKLSNVRNFSAVPRPGRGDLKLRAGVRVDFAVQANFFKSGCGPLHDCFSHFVSSVAASKRSSSLTHHRAKIKSQNSKCCLVWKMLMWGQPPRLPGRAKFDCFTRNPRDGAKRTHPNPRNWRLTTRLTRKRSEEASERIPTDKISLVPQRFPQPGTTPVTSASRATCLPWHLR